MISLSTEFNSTTKDALIFEKEYIKFEKVEFFESDVPTFMQLHVSIHNLHNFNFYILITFKKSTVHFKFQYWTSDIISTPNM